MIACEQEDYQWPALKVMYGETKEFNFKMG
jgi:hypothetical protein